jgi:Pyruvate/2-oxoacid:ferredoxin oxidoreductase gamma subunit
MIPVFPLNVFRDRKPEIKESTDPPQRSVADVLEVRNTETRNETTRHAHNFRDLSIKIAGFGGQGVLLLGQLLTEMGMREGLEVSWLPSYGPEMRSGSAHCHVCLSKERIGSPLISRPDILIAMNEISLRRFASQVQSGGLIFYNRDHLPADFTPPQARVICIPASEIADKLGSARVANVVIMGALLEETEVLASATAIGVIETIVRKVELLETNRKAFDAGREFGDNRARLRASRPDSCQGKKETTPSPQELV